MEKDNGSIKMKVLDIVFRGLPYKKSKMSAAVKEDSAIDLVQRTRKAFRK